uniref:Retrotransposon gag domain-containing protein n=1 Tax=Brassica oleracea var. oleracea TaxID=109376 RepID=A0A0D3CFN3_BRAOL
MSTRSSKEIGLLLVEPLDLERVIHKSKRAVDTLQAAIGSVEIQASIDAIQLVSENIVHHGTVHQALFIWGTVHPGTVHPDTVHPVKNDTCGETEKVEVLILKVDENGMLRDEEGRPRNSTRHLINAQGVVLPDVIDVAEMNDFARAESGMIGWFSQLQPGSLTSWEDTERAFLYKFIDDAEGTREREKNDKWDRLVESWQIKREDQIPRQVVDYIMAEGDEQHRSGELSRVEEADISDTSSASIDTSTSTLIDSTTSTSTNGTLSTSIDGTTSTSTNCTTSTSIDGTTSESITLRIQASIDGDSYFRTRPPIWTEEASGFQKRVKRIHDPVKIVVPCAVFEAETPIPPDRSMQISSYIEVLDDHQHVEASQRGLRFRDEVDKGPTEAASIDTNRIPLNDTIYAISNDINKPASINATISPSIDTGRISEQKEFDVCGNLRDEDTTMRSDKSRGKKMRNWKKRKMIMGDSQLSFIPRFSDGVKKSRVCSRCFSKPFAKVKGKDPRNMSLHEDRRWLCIIDRQSITSIDRSLLNCVNRQSFKSIDRHLTVMVDTHIKFRSE